MRENEIVARGFADMVSVSFPIASFAAVTAFYSITHVRRAEHAAMFKRIAKWLKPGGIFLASLGCRFLRRF